MAWDFTIDDEFSKKLDWMSTFVREEIEPLDLLWGNKVYRYVEGKLKELLDSLKQRVRDEELWACPLTPQLGGGGYGQVKLALMNQIIGRSPLAPIIVGCQAPDTGNAAFKHAEASALISKRDPTTAAARLAKVATLLAFALERLGADHEHR